MRGLWIVVRQNAKKVELARFRQNSFTKQKNGPLIRLLSSVPSTINDSYTDSPATTVFIWNGHTTHNTITTAQKTISTAKKTIVKMKLSWIGIYAAIALVEKPVAVAGLKRFGIFSAILKPDMETAKKDDRSSTKTQNRSSRQHKDDGPRSSEGSWLDGMEFEDYNPAESILQETEQELQSTNLLDPLQLNPLLQIPLSASLNGILTSDKTPIRSFCDTAAMRTVMSYALAQKLGIVHHMDRRYAGQAVGVGSCAVLGRIPAGIFDLHLYGTVTVPSPAITILEESANDSVELLLGLDFLRENKAILDLRNEELRILVKGKEHAIPFLRPRGITGLSGGGADLLNSCSELGLSTRNYRSDGSMIFHDGGMDDEYEYYDDEDEGEDFEVDMTGV